MLKRPLGALVMLLGLTCGSALGETFPNEPVRYVAGFSPGTVTAIFARLDAEMSAVLAQPDVRDRLLGLGAEVVGGAPDNLTWRLREEQDQVRQVVKRIEAKQGKLKP